MMMQHQKVKNKMNGKKIPQRKCVGCNEMKDKSLLVRVVKTPEDTFLVDASGRANGRGAYICKDIECLHKAMKNKGLERSLKCKIPEDIVKRLEEEMI